LKASLQGEGGVLDLHWVFRLNTKFFSGGVVQVVLEVPQVFGALAVHFFLLQISGVI
jgi:hypothetical protein